MTILSIAIENFQSFFGKHEIKLSDGVNIFWGLNQSGKSKLFNAINFCFLDRIYTSNFKDRKGWHKTSFYEDSIINLHAKSHEKSKIDVGVTIVFVDSSASNRESETYTLTRTLCFKNFEGEYRKVDQALYLKKESEGLTKIFESEREILSEFNDIFPSEIINYIWYQGESIDQLIDFNKGSSLRDAIKKISYFSTYDDLSSFITTAKRKVVDLAFNQSSKREKSTSIYSNALQKIKDFNNSIKNNEERIKELEEEISEKKNEIKENAYELSKIQAYPSYNIRLNNIANEIENIDNSIKSKERKRREKTQGAALLIGLDKIMLNAKKVLNKVKIEYPDVSSIKEFDNPMPKIIPGMAWLEQMLDKKVCFLCEREFDSDSPAEHALKERHNYSNKPLESNPEFERVKQKEFFLTDLKNKPNEIIQLISTEKEALKSIENELLELLENKKAKIKEQRELKNEVKQKFGTDEISGGANRATTLLNKNELLQEEIDLKNRQINKLNNKISEDNGELKEYIQKRDKHSPKDKDKSFEEIASPYYEFLSTSLEVLKSKAYEDLVNKIESKANELYEEYQENRSVSGGSLVIDRDTFKLKNYVNRKSKVERDSNQSNIDLAKLACINGILKLTTEVTGKSYPFIADALSATFDQPTTMTYTKGLKNTFDQAIIMSMDYSLEDLEELKCLGYNVFKISFEPVNKSLESNDDNNTTKIIEI